MFRSPALRAPNGANTPLDRGPPRAFLRGPPNWFASPYQSLLIQNGILDRERRPSSAALAAGAKPLPGGLDFESSPPLTLQPGLQDSPVGMCAGSGCSPKGFLPSQTSRCFPGFTEEELNIPR